MQCITVRDIAEHPVRLEKGTNRPCGKNLDDVMLASAEVFDRKHIYGSIPELWDGSAAKRIVDMLLSRQ